MDQVSFGTSEKRTMGFMRRLRAPHFSESKSFIVNALTEELPDAQEECEAAGHYWYDNACHLYPKEPEPEFDWSTIILASTAIGIGLAIVLSLK